MQLLLASSSFVSGKGYLEHCREAVQQFMQACPPGEVLFVPYASASRHWDEYAASGEKFFGSINQPYRSIHTCADPAAYIDQSEIKSIFVGGGNTFLLIKMLQDMSLIEPIRKTVHDGVGYVGTSAGSNVACPTIQTTNDMPIVTPSGFEALNFVDFQLNPHFVPGDLIEGHQGETREQRINEYHEHNNTTVIGLPELDWIKVDHDSVSLGGGAEAAIFVKDQPTRSWSVGTSLTM
jgi:dipeptidase E